jgi:hypothetical protein
VSLVAGQVFNATAQKRGLAEAEIDAFRSEFILQPTKHGQMFLQDGHQVASAV